MRFLREGHCGFLFLGTKRNFDLSRILQRTTRTVNRWPLWQLFRRVMVRPVFRENLWRGSAANQLSNTFTKMRHKPKVWIGFWSQQTTGGWKKQFGVLAAR